MTEVQTFEDVVRILTEIVTERGPDYVDPRSATGYSCSYVTHEDDDGFDLASKPCIVGAFYEKLGVDEDTRGELDGCGSVESVFESDQSPVLVTLRGAKLLHEAQKRQDGGANYGKVLSEAVTALDYSRYDNRYAFSGPLWNY